MARQDDEPSFGLEVEVSTATRGEILRTIRKYDSAAQDSLDEDSPLEDIRRYATQPAFSNGVRVRGPLAGSTEEYLDSFLRVGKIRWISILDRRTDERDRELNNTVWDAADISSPVPPLHFRCRCRRVPIADNPEIYDETPVPVAEQPAEDITTAGDQFEPPGPAPILPNKAKKPTTKKAVQKDLTVQFLEVVGTEYEAYRAAGLLKFEGSEKRIGKAKIGGSIKDDQATVIFEVIQEQQQEAARLGIPPLRGIAASKSTRKVASMGDGILEISADNLVDVTVKSGSDLIRLKKQRRRYQAQVDRIQKMLLAGVVNRSTLEGLVDSAKEIIDKIDEKIAGFARSPTKWAAATWTPGDPPAKRPVISAEFFDNTRDRTKAVLDHEFGHHIHQSKGGTRLDRFPWIDSPIEKRLSDIRRKYDKAKREGTLDKLLPTTYAENPGENRHLEPFAECWALHKGGRNDLIPKMYLDLINEIDI